MGTVLCVIDRNEEKTGEEFYQSESNIFLQYPGKYRAVKSRGVAKTQMKNILFSRSFSVACFRETTKNERRSRAYCVS